MKNESFIFLTIKYEINKNQNFIEIMWPVDYKKDPFCLHNYL